MKAALPAVLFLASACAAPPPRDLVWIEAPGGPRAGVATEDGVVTLDGDDLDAAPVRLRQWIGPSAVVDDADVARRDGVLARLQVRSARFTRSRFAAEPPAPDEPLFVLVQDDDPEHHCELLPARLWDGGRRGDLLRLRSWFADPEDVARRFAGTGVYVRRQGAYELVGLLNGLIVERRRAGRRSTGPYLAFVPLERIAPLLPAGSRFFERRIRVFRPDFEYGEPAVPPTHAER